jgi:hypothetical protein
MSCQTEPRFQDARDASNPFKSYEANLHTRLTKPQFEGKLLRTLHTWHNPSYVDVVYGPERPGAVEVKRPGDAHHPGVANICIMMDIMRKAGSDALPWFAESDGQ